MIDWETKKANYQQAGMPAWWISQKRVEHYEALKTPTTEENKK